MKSPVTWFSIPSDDIVKAGEFYKKAFDWDILPETKEENPVFNYTVALNSDGDDEYVSYERGKINGCIVKKSTGITHPVMLIEVDDLQAAMNRIKDAGGQVVSEVIPMNSLSGSFFLAKDLDGNMMEVFKSND